ncbi:MAG TPA: alpha/beta fold hydrolase, partial [Roseiflexaceae bacterium]|nr:alpha/beta fold hydrolase [Roseiflexaceae bacterium]
MVTAFAPARTWAQTGQKSAAWSAIDCATFKLENIPADSGVECGYVSAPLRHEQPEGPKIQLGTVIIPSKDANRQPDPLFLAQGGPGGSTIGTFASIIISSPQYNPAPNRDLVLWDQRGTLFSKPALLCPEVTEAELRAALVDGQSTDSGDDLGPYKGCGARLAKEAGDLSAFNSAENADDIEDVRAALGYDQINYWGVSYGTELGQFVLRRQPDHLRAVILDAVVPLTYNLFTEPAFAKQRIATKYFEACAADARCNAAFPNLAERYRALYDRLNANPVTLTVSPLEPEGGILNNKTYQVKLSGSGLESALYQALYGPVHDLMPLIVDRADKGDFTYVADFLLPAGLFDTSMAEGMYFAVACADRADTNPDRVDYSAINPRLAEAERDGAKAEVALCKELGIQLLPRDQLEPVQSDKPVLLLSGDYDP